MLSEEALILYASFVGLGLLVLGVWELLAPSRIRVHPPGRRPRDRAQAPRP